MKLFQISEYDLVEDVAEPATKKISMCRINLSCSLRTSIVEILLESIWCPKFS